MKQFVKIFVPVAAAAIALFSCAKETKAPVPEGIEISVSAAVDEIDAPATASKTYMGASNTILWGEAEQMKIAITGEATVFANSASTNAYNGQKQATFSFTLTPPAGSSFLHQGIYPASAAMTSENNNPASYKVELPAVQAATAASYDPAAYILVAYPQSFDEVKTEWKAYFRRATALNKITLTGLSEDIVSVEFTAPEGAVLAGRRHINLATGESGDIYYGGTNVLKVNYAAALTGASKAVWFTSWEATIPEGQTLKVVAKSATKSYTRTITARADGIKFLEGKLNLLEVDMSSATEETLADYSGNYVILGIKDGKWYIMDPANTGKYYPTLATEIDADAENDDFSVLQGVANINDYIFTVATYEGAYSIKSTSTNKYVCYKGGSNEAYAADALGDSTKFAIEYNATTKAATISSVNVSGRKLVFNSGSPRFACYTSDQAGAYLMPAVIDSRTAVTLTFPSAEVNQTSQDYGDFYGLQASSDPNVSEVTSAITYAWTGDDIFSDFDTDTGDLELSGTAGSATITATFAGSTNYKPAHASYTVTVTDASKQYYTKVTSAPGDWSGEYLLVCDSEGKVLSEISTGSTKFGVGADATITAGKIESTATIDAYKVTIAPASAGSAYTMDFAGEYLYWGSGNSLNVSDSESDNSRWTITAGATAGNWIITNVAQDTRVIWYNTGSPRFACYENKTETTTGYAPVQLYKLEDNRPALATPQNLAVSGMTVSWSAVSGAASYSVTVGSASTSVNTNSYTFSGDAGYYNVSVVAVPGDNSYKNSAAATLTGACFGSPVLPAPVLTAGLQNENTVQATWTLDSRATAGYHAVIKIKGNDAEVSSQDVTVGSVTFTGLAGNTEYTVFVYAKAVTGDKPYGQSATSSIDLSTQTAITISTVIAGGGSGSFTVGNVTVLAVPATNTAIIGDATGKVLFYLKDHGLAVGDVITVGGETTLYNGVVEFTNTPTATKTGTTTVNHGSATEPTATFLAPLAGASSSVVYVSGKGRQTDGQNISVNGYTFHLPAANAATSGKYVTFTGYIYGWSTSYNNFNFYALEIAEDTNAPTLSVSPTSKTWAYNETDQVTFTVSATNCTWSHSASVTWANVVKDGNTLKVTPTGANGGTSDLTGTITISGTASGYDITPIEISLKQTKSGGSSTVMRYVKVTSGDIPGEYLIVRESSSYVFDGSLATPDSNNNYKTAASLSSLDYDTWKAYAVTIESYSTGYSIKTASGKYIGRNANSNGIDNATTLSANYVNTISFASNGTVEILGKGGRKFNFNTSSGKFRYFAASNTTEVYLYKLQEVSE